MRHLLLSIAFMGVLCASAAAQGPAPRTRPPTDTVRYGTYNLELTTDNGTMTGWLTVRREGDGLVAQINAGGMMPAVHSFTREASDYVLKGGHDKFTVTYTMRFARDSVAGSFAVSSGLKGTFMGAFQP